jgi:hypothetical protein
MQVMMHQEASVIVGETQDLVQDNNSELRDFLSNTVDTINTHRDRAGDVLNSLL